MQAQSTLGTFETTQISPSADLIRRSSFATSRIAESLDQRVKRADGENGELNLHCKLPRLAVTIKIARHHAFNAACRNTKALQRAALSYSGG